MCYSDHDEDIRVYGRCEFCNSTQPVYVKHKRDLYDRVVIALNK